MTARIFGFQLLFVSLPLKTVDWLAADPLGEEESPGNTGHSASQREEIRESLIMQKKTTARQLVRVRRQGKSLPGW